MYTARAAKDSTDFVLVLEDLQNWDNADHLAGLSWERTRLSISSLAGLHAWSADPANGDALAGFPSMDTPMTRELLPAAFGPAWQVYRDKSAAPVPDAVARYAERFAEHAATAVTALSERSMLVHGDMRADNMFFSGEQLKVVDFQLAARGAGAADVGYVASQGLPTPLRSGRDEELVREYVAAAYLIVLPVALLLSWDTLPERSRELCLTLTGRAVATIDEIDAVEVFG